MSFSGIEELLRHARSKSLTLEERSALAIELAGQLLKKADAHKTQHESRRQKMLSKMMEDPLGKAFTVAATDYSFRAKSLKRSANQIKYLIDNYGIPAFATPLQKIGLRLFSFLSPLFPELSMHFFKKKMRKETMDLIIPGEEIPLKEHIRKRKSQRVRVNVNHLGEAILGEAEARHRLHTYLEDLKKKEIDYISVKISSICSQINLLAWEDTLSLLSERMVKLYRAAKKYPTVRSDASFCYKFVNLDMEEYRDLYMTVELFQKVLSLNEFHDLSAGIVLQAYLPDSLPLQQKLTEWAKERVRKGGAPIKIRLVKGANLALEKVESSLHHFEQAPYTQKWETDASFKEMLHFGLDKKTCAAVHIGIASHNIFDIAYAMVLSAENGVEEFVTFEMLEGMADHLRRAVQEHTGNMLLYCPVAKEADFVSAIAYLVRRLDENTGPDNFLRASFGMEINTPSFDAEKERFKASLDKMGTLKHTKRRGGIQASLPYEAPFDNEPNTDWSLKENQEFLSSILNSWEKREVEKIPCVINGRIIEKENPKSGCDPSFIDKVIYTYTVADALNAKEAIQAAVEAPCPSSIEERSRLLYETAKRFRENRGNLIGAMMADGGKTPQEADVEVSEAIDYLEYYRRSQKAIESQEGLQFFKKGVVLVTPPWNFPCAIPVGGIAAALASGNSVIFKPAGETILVGWILVNLFWDAGFDKKTLQFVLAEDEVAGNFLVKDRAVNVVLLTGSTETAKLMMKMRPGIDLLAETGGKNSIIVTALADKDLAVKEIVHSAFSHSGQKCSACSLLILEKEVYEDPFFLKQLHDAASSLRVGSIWNVANKMGPLIRAPEKLLYRGLTTLDLGEEWLLQPKQDPENQRIWTPGIKMGVREGSFMHQTELFGPLLGVMKAENFKHALALANGTPYGLTAGLQSLDPRERLLWEGAMHAGNLYVNRSTTGAVVLRQPFGGCKESSFGVNYKTGGPNFLLSLQKIEERALPKESSPLSKEVKDFEALIHKDLTLKECELLKASFGSYAFFYDHYFSKGFDPVRLLGQDNSLSYVPYQDLSLRFNFGDNPFFLLQVIGALLTLKSPIDLSLDFSEKERVAAFFPIEKVRGLEVHFESERASWKRFQKKGIRRVRLLSEPSKEFTETAALYAITLISGVPLAHGRVELLKYLREKVVSFDYHRYGNLSGKDDDGRKVS